MRNTIRFVIGILALINVVYKLATCPSCDESIFGFSLSGTAYILIYSVLTAFIFYVAFKMREREKNA